MKTHDKPYNKEENMKEIRRLILESKIATARAAFLRSLIRKEKK